MIYFYWVTGLGFALTLSVLICVAGERDGEAPADTQNQDK